MQAINIDRSLAVIEDKLKDCKCLSDIIALAKMHPENINQFISLAESIELDLNRKDISVKAVETKEHYTAYFVMPSISLLIPKGRYVIAFCDNCFYLDSSTKQIRIDYSNIQQIINIGTLDVKNLTNIVVALKAPIKVGKKKIDSICIPFDNHTDKKMIFEDKKRQVRGKAYSIFLTVLKLKFPFTLLKPEPHYFISSQRTSFINCYHGTSPCWLIPIRNGLVIITSSNVHYIPKEDVIAMNLDRLGGSTFDFTVKTNKKKQFDLSMVAKEERSCLEEYSKEVIKENRKRQGGSVTMDEESDSSDEAFSAESDNASDKEQDAKAMKELISESDSAISEEDDSSSSDSKRMRLN